MRARRMRAESRLTNRSAWSTHSDHHVGGLDNNGDGITDLDAELIDRLVGDRGGHDVAADIDTYVGGGGALLDLDDGTLDLVACTDAHVGGLPHVLSRSRTSRARRYGWLKEKELGTVVPSEPGACGAPAFDFSAIRSEQESALISRFRVRCIQHGAARRWQLRQRDAPARFWRLLLRLGMNDLVLEPICQLGRLAAFAAALIRLAVTILAAARAFDADMEMVIVTIPRPDFRKPGAIALGLAAQCLLDRGVDEDALHAGLLGRIAQYHPVLLGPCLRIDIESVLPHHHGGGHFLAILARQQMIRHRRQPDVGIKTDLVAGMAR